VMGGLESLVEQNLVRPRETDGEPRFFMLHVIREFALEQLSATGQADEIRTRHSQAFLRHAEDAVPHLAGSESKRWLDQLETEHDNIRAALGHQLAAHQAEDALRMVSSLWRFWQRRGHLLEGRSRIADALAVPGADEFVEALMRALDAAGGIAWWEGDVESCVRFYERALALAREVGSTADLANALYNLGFPLASTADGVDRALELDREALSLFEELADKAGAARTRFAMARILAGWEQFEEAMNLAEGAASAFRELDLRYDLIWALHLAGLTEVRLKLLDRARQSLTEGFGLLADSGDLSGYAVFLGDFSDMAVADGDTERALRLRGASNAIQAQTGAGVETAARSTFLARATVGSGLDDAQVQALIDEGGAMSADSALAYALHPD